jgi:hypothetical protein
MPGNHRAGRLKQTNKRHKVPGGTRPSSEKAVNGRTNGGPAAAAPAKAAPRVAPSNKHVTNSNAVGAKQARLNRQKQLMAEKRLALFKQRRQRKSLSLSVAVSQPLTKLPFLSQNNHRSLVSSLSFHYLSMSIWKHSMLD